MSTEFSIRDAISPTLRRAMDRLRDKRPILKLAAEAVIGIGERSFNDPAMRSWKSDASCIRAWIINE